MLDEIAMYIHMYVFEGKLCQFQTIPFLYITNFMDGPEYTVWHDD